MPSTYCESYKSSHSNLLAILPLSDRWYVHASLCGVIIQKSALYSIQGCVSCNIQVSRLTEYHSCFTRTQWMCWWAIRWKKKSRFPCHCANTNVCLTYWWFCVFRWTDCTIMYIFVPGFIFICLLLWPSQYKENRSREALHIIDHQCGSKKTETWHSQSTKVVPPFKLISKYKQKRKIPFCVILILC